MEPYTSSVDTCTNRETPASSAACSSTWVPTTLVETKSAAPVIERSTCDSAAKCTTTSTPAITRATTVGVADVAAHEAQPRLARPGRAGWSACRRR